MPRTKVFLTWSGQRSKAVAYALWKWLPKVIQSLDPWMSENDIDKGTKWAAEISGQLEQTKIGIICLTPENVAEPWINFEAGALSKLGNSRVCTYLYDLATQTIPFPLAQFQSTKAAKEDTKKMLLDINKALDDERLPDDRLREVFETWWPELSDALTHIPAIASAVPPSRKSTEEVLEEIVSTIRGSSHTQSTILNELRLIRDGLEATSKKSFIGLDPGRTYTFGFGGPGPILANKDDGIITPPSASILVGSYPPSTAKTKTQKIQTEDKEPSK